jgi:hypothetical protein
VHPGFVAPRRLVATILVELLVRIEFVLQFAQQQLQHDRVVDEAEHRHVVRHEVLDVGDVGEAVQYASALEPGQLPPGRPASPPGAKRSIRRQMNGNAPSNASAPRQPGRGGDCVRRTLLGGST